jgi:hypothetical protein
MSRRGASRPSGHRGEAAVSDILGSIMLIGITVVAAAGFGLLILNFRGPTDTQHTQLSITVGPGADGVWAGANGAELRIRHLGGEPLQQAGAKVVYQESGQAPTSVTPTFAGGQLTVGQSWTRAITALPGDAIPVQVVARSKDLTLLLATSTITAGSTVPTSIWVTAANAATGSVEPANPLAGAQSDTDSDAFLALDEGASAGTPSAFTLSPSGTSGTATNPSFVSTQDGTNAAQLTGGQFVQATYGAPSGFVVSQVRVNAVMKATQASTPAAYGGVVATGTMTGTSQNFVQTSTTVTGSAGDVYLAAVASGMSPSKAVSSVTGPPGVTWTQVGAATNSAGQLEVWLGLGTPTSAAAVRANFQFKSGSDIPENAAIAVTRYSGVDASSASQAVQATQSGTGSPSGTSVTLPAIAGTASSGIFYAALNGVTATGAQGVTFATPGSERADVDPGTLNKVQLGVADGTAAATNGLSATLSSAASWQAISLTLRPIIPPLPTVTLSYTLSGGPTGATTLSPTLTAGYVTYTADITADRPSWSPADVGNIAVRVTYTTSTGSTVQVDYLSVTGTITSSAATYSLSATLDFAFGATVMGSSETVQMRYKTNGVDSFSVAVLTGATPRTCPGTLSSTTYTVFSCALLLPGEHNGGTPRIRITDTTPSGTNQGVISIEYARLVVL